jgi:antitoxin ParD1/3/4
LPKALGEFVARQAATKGFKSPSRYLESLVRETKARDAEKELEQLILDGLNSGPATPVTAETWEEIRKQGKAILASKRK